MSGFAKQQLGVGVAGFGGLCDNRKNARKDFIRGGASAIAKFGPTGKFEMAEDFCADRGVGTGAVTFANGGSNGETADVIGAALVAEKRTVTTGSGCVAVCVSAERGGARAGYEHDGGGPADGFEREFEIGDEADFRIREGIRNLALHFFVGLRATDSREARAEGGDFTEFDAGFSGSGLRGLSERSGGGFMADAEWVGRA